MATWRIAAGGLAGAAYLAMCYLLMREWGDRPWALAAMWAPVWAGATLDALRRRHAARIAAAAAALAVLALIAWRAGPADLNRLYLVQHVGIHAALAWAFRPHGEPRRSLIEGLARRLHQRFPPEMSRYAHKVSAAWTAYFLAVAALSVGLYAFAPWSVWTVYANVVTPVAALLFFLGEHALRYTLHPEFERASLADAVRAYRTADAGAPAPR